MQPCKYRCLCTHLCHIQVFVKKTYLVMGGDGQLLDHVWIKVILPPHKVLSRINHKLDRQQLMATVSQGDDSCTSKREYLFSVNTKAGSFYTKASHRALQTSMETRAKTMWVHNDMCRKKILDVYIKQNSLQDVTGKEVPTESLYGIRDWSKGDIKTA